MQNNVVSITGGRIPEIGEPNSVLIQVLEDVLEHAKSGRLQSFVGTGMTADGCRLACWGPLGSDVYQMLGAIEWLKLEYTDRILGRVEKHHP